MERKLIGRVGVDSGQLMVMDPSYIKSQWENDGEEIGIQFWGAGGDKVADILTKQGIAIESNLSSYFLRFSSKSPKELSLLVLKNAMESIEEKVVSFIKTTGTYDQISDITLGENQAGSLPYRMGNEGLAVAFSSGFGDGVYDVFATYKDYGNYEYSDVRIKSVEIILIEDEEDNNTK
ncbi:MULTISPECIES: hypothetical protein [unclassified Psychrobacillus]|uniref:hypothetical protein n=1 Tax=unclassified Psychrobacillus TaxID=2636677 RepID=UPI0030F815D5